MPDPTLQRLRQEAARAKQLAAQTAHSDEPDYRKQAEVDRLNAEARRLYGRIATLEKARKSHLSRIHIARKDLGLDDATYRALCARVADGVDSAGDMTERQRRALLAELRRLGWQGGAPKRAGRAPRPQTLSRRAMLTKIEAQLAAAKLPWAYAESILRRQRGLADATACPISCATDTELRAVIAALWQRAKRQPRPENPA
jgi:predicted Fe-S protein YdhL (DUF1289 family)